MSGKPDIYERILSYTKAEIISRSFIMSAAFNYINFIPNNSTQSFSVFGNNIYYNTAFLLKAFSFDSGRTLSRYILHCIFHFICKNTPASQKGDALRELSCDIMIERMIDELFVFKTKDSFFDIKRCNNIYRRKVYSFIKAHTKMPSDKRIYRLFIRKNTNISDVFDKSSLISEFTFDVPFCVNTDEKNENIPKMSAKELSEANEMASKAAKIIKISLSVSGENDISYLLDISSQKQTDYKSFLRKFAVLTETMKEDNESFDYALYNYGNEYLNAPIIEPVEYSQAHSIDGFVIAIDTSASCSVSKIKKFIQTACGIIQESLEMSDALNVYIIQCDFKIQSIAYLKNTSDLKSYIESFKVFGGGGTDFAPVFEYAEKNIKSVRGLIYFTDGNGSYPKEMPPFDTAFIFLDSENNISPPRWAKKIILSESDI